MSALRSHLRHLLPHPVSLISNQYIICHWICSTNLPSVTHWSSFVLSCEFIGQCLHAKLNSSCDISPSTPHTCSLIYYSFLKAVLAKERTHIYTVWTLPLFSKKSLIVLHHPLVYWPYLCSCQMDKATVQSCILSPSVTHNWIVRLTALRSSTEILFDLLCSFLHYLSHIAITYSPSFWTLSSLIALVPSV